jgi:hypothetical protein
MRGRREGQVLVAPAVRVQQKARGRTTGTAEQPAFPARWFDGLYAISPGTGCLAPVVRNARHERCDLDASTGTSGPRDFTVRTPPVVAQMRLMKPRPPHPRLTSPDDRETPLSAKRDGAIKPLIWGECQEIFCYSEFRTSAVPCPRRIGPRV